MTAPFGLYVHVPFCAALCPYCDFAVVVGREDLHERYLRALVDEAAARAWGDRAGSVFIGGGTPTFVDPATLAATLRALGEIVPVDDDAEITIEANPESVSADGLRALRDAGVTRVSIGAQSFSTPVLRALGRTHSVDDVVAAVAAARAAGVDNVSLDLIYGGLGETMDEWRASVDAAIGLGVDHVSCYALTIEDRTAFGKAVARGAMRAPDDDDLAAKYDLACDRLDQAGFEHYEISNWAKPGMQSRHNLVYWTQGNYLGLGVGAHSHRDGRRWWNVRAVSDYLRAPADAIAGDEVLDPGARADEWLSLRMRLLEGIDVPQAESRLGRILRLDELEGAGLITREGPRMRLSRRGMLLENEVTARLLDA